MAELGRFSDFSLSIISISTEQKYVMVNQSGWMCSKDATVSCEIQSVSSANYINRNVKVRYKKAC